MLIKILGAIDVAAAFILFFNKSYAFPATLLMIFGMLLITKSLFGFLQDFGSWIDLGCGITLMVSIIFTLPLIIFIVCGIFVLQKGITSFL